MPTYNPINIYSYSYFYLCTLYIRLQSNPKNNTKIYKKVAKIVKNSLTGGNCSVFKKGDSYFYADRSFVPFCGMETMIFPCKEDGEVTDWSEVYCDRSGKSLQDCIDEFLAE